MTLEQLRIFVAVAERQHVTRAAETLNLAQSAASAAVAALEARHGVRLFHRVGRGIQLTEAGALFLHEARAVLARAAAAEATLAEIAGLRRGALTVQASQTIASYWLPRYLVRYHRAYPDIEIRLTVGNTQQVAASVHEGVVELGFVEGGVDDPLLVSTAIARDQLVVVVGPEHPWSARAAIAPAELTASEWVLGALTRIGVFLETLRSAADQLTPLESGGEVGGGGNRQPAGLAAADISGGRAVQSRFAARGVA